MKKITYFALMLMLASLVFSCKKKDPEPTPQQKVTGNWRLTFARITVDGVSENGQPCELDNTFNFQASGAFTIDEGATKCDPSDPQTSTGTWSITADGKTMNINDSNSGGISVAFEVLELTSKVMRIKANNVLGLGIIVEYSFEKI